MSAALTGSKEQTTLPVTKRTGCKHQAYHGKGGLGGD